MCECQGAFSRNCLHSFLETEVDFLDLDAGRDSLALAAVSSPEKLSAGPSSGPEFAF